MRSICQLKSFGHKDHCASVLDKEGIENNIVTMVTVDISDYMFCIILFHGLLSNNGNGCILKR